MILNWKIKTIKRPKWNTEIVVKTWARKYEKVFAWREFEMYDTEGNILVEGTSKWILIDIRKGKITQITDELIEKYGHEDKSVFADNISEKLLEPEGMYKVLEYTSSNRDIDSNNHVNNIIYLEYAYNAFEKDLPRDFENIEIFYKKQIKLRRNCFVILFK